MKIRIPLLCCLVALFVGSAWADNKKAARWTTFKVADAVVVVKLDKVTPGGILYTLPPVYTAELRLVPEDVVRGPFRKGVAFTAYHNLKQMNAPVYPVGKTCVVALARDRQGNTWTVFFLEIADEENVKEAKAAK